MISIGVCAETKPLDIAATTPPAKDQPQGKNSKEHRRFTSLVCCIMKFKNLKFLSPTTTTPDLPM